MSSPITWLIGFYINHITENQTRTVLTEDKSRRNSSGFGEEEKNEATEAV